MDGCFLVIVCYCVREEEERQEGNKVGLIPFLNADKDSCVFGFYLSMDSILYI